MDKKGRIENSRRIVIVSILMILLHFYGTLFAGPFAGFGVGYEIKNIYTDKEGTNVQEHRVPLIESEIGYNIKRGFINFRIHTCLDFFGMDIIRGNRNITFFTTPNLIIISHFQLGNLIVFGGLGYGEIYRWRYIKNKVYLQPENSFLNSANDERKTSGLLINQSFAYDEWLESDFSILKDFFSISVQLRTPRAKKNSPYINIHYKLGKEFAVLSIGLIYHY
ncbi:MAG: hypothetical protein B5M53_04220 [Candidatus Cloacimonas sp. 4484_209]|nr:MAG: hypothetical protein B5M53_04220 [Candidatus Cloacimonas sp. 4484_209]